MLKQRTTMSDPHDPTPRSIDELMRRAIAVSGLRVGDVARDVGVPPPDASGFGKGWAGNVIETALGAAAGSKQGPDFPGLGVELKTIPVRADGKPLESTWVTTVDLLHAGALRWATSHVRNKLACVLWVPLLAGANVAAEDRQIGSPLLWRPSAAQEAALRSDWNELMELVVLGRSEEITANLGQVLQIRPKGAKASSRVLGIGADGEQTAVQPRGFYLRPAFTAQILADGFAL